MTPHTIPVDLLLEYLNACQPVVARVSDRICPHDPLSTAVVPLVACVSNHAKLTPLIMSS
jgi:hypothetical protein